MFRSRWATRQHGKGDGNPHGRGRQTAKDGIYTAVHTATDTAKHGRLETQEKLSGMFSQSNPLITQIRRELRGQLPDQWMEEVIGILEYQLTYQSVDELSTEDLLKLKIASGFSQALNQALTRGIQPQQQQFPPNPFSQYLGES